MAALLEDIQNGNGGRLTAEGWEFTRIALVTGLTGLGASKIRAGTQVSGFPAIGDSHPDVPEAKLVDVAGEAESTQVVRYVLTYREKGVTPTIRVGSALGQVTTNLDKDDAELVVEHNGKSVIAEASVLRPEMNISLEIQIDDGDLPDEPGEIAKDFVGKVNEAGWTIDPTADEGTWLCTSIEWESPDNGATWIGRFEFQFRAEGWGQRIYWIDPESGRPPADLVEGTGVIDAEFHALADFNALPSPVGTA